MEFKRKDAQEEGAPQHFHFRWFIQRKQQTLKRSDNSNENDKNYIQIFAAAAASTKQKCRHARRKADNATIKNIVPASFPSAGFYFLFLFFCFPEALFITTSCPGLSTKLKIPLGFKGNASNYVRERIGASHAKVWGENDMIGKQPNEPSRTAGTNLNSHRLPGFLLSLCSIFWFSI